MSKNKGTLFERLLKNSVVGSVIAMISYVMLQLLCALLVHCEIVGEGMIYPMVCVGAAVSSFLGCVYGVMRGGEGRILSASVVAVIFMSLTIMIGLLSGKSDAIASGWVGIGSAMAVGGLLAAMVPSLMSRREKVLKSSHTRRKVRK